MSTLDLSKVRSQFPALATGFIFGDNAGGSQTCKQSIDTVTDWLTNTNAQLGADYSVSQKSTSRVYEGPEAAQKLFNAASKDEVTFASSTTQNLENLCRGLEADIKEGDQFILTGEHEANVGPWKKLATRRKAVVKYWPYSLLDSNNPYSKTLAIPDLIPLVTSKTRIVAISACSNILGSITPVKEVVKAVREAAAKQGSQKVQVSVDCVAYAPHRRMDVRDWDVDFAAFSFYKIYGPHTGALYVRKSILDSDVTPLTHHFLPTKGTGYSLAPGGHGYELTAGSAAVVPYLHSLTPESSIEAAFDAIAKHERALNERLLGYLCSDEVKKRGVYVVGDERTTEMRAPTVSFVVAGERPVKSTEVVKAFDETGKIGIRFGHFYAYKLVSELLPDGKFDAADGVVRISLVHYNTVEEVDEIIGVLKKVLA